VIAEIPQQHQNVFTAIEKLLSFSHRPNVLIDRLLLNRADGRLFHTVGL